MLVWTAAAYAHKVKEYCYNVLQLVECD